MVVQLVKLKAEHLEQLMDQDYMAPMRPFITAAHAKNLEEAANTYTVVTATGRIAACGGLNKCWPGRAEAWAIFDLQLKSTAIFLAIHNAVRNVLDACDFKRIECTVESDFKAGHRWAKALGFELEAPKLRAYMPGGADVSLYARIK